MAKRVSFTKYEHQVLPKFRQKMNSAESTEDVKKFFVYTARDLLSHVFQGKMDIHYEDILLTPDIPPYYAVSERVRSSEDFESVWNESDLLQVIGRLAESAMGRYRHLEKHPEKTDAKIRM